jgi:hypothetical protein
MHGTANDTGTGNLERIILRSLWPSGNHPVRLYGKFQHGELCYAEAPDMQISWTRAHDQSCEAFEIMIANAILAARGLPEIDPAPERRGQSARHTAARHLAAYRRTARACH